MDKKVRRELLSAMRVLDAASTSFAIIDGVLTSPVAPDIVYRTGLCVNFTQGYEVCPPEMLRKMKIAEVAFRTNNQQASPEEILALWREVIGEDRSRLLVMPNVRIPSGSRGFIPPVDTLMRRMGETHVHTYGVPLVTLKSDITGNSRTCMRWVVENYYSQGDSNGLFDRDVVNNERHFHTAWEVANALLREVSLRSAIPTALRGHTLNLLKNAVTNLKVIRSAFGANTKLEQSYISKETTLALVMLHMNLLLTHAV